MRQEKTNLHAGYSHRDNNYPVHMHTHTHIWNASYFFPLSLSLSLVQRAGSLVSLPLLFHYSRFSFSSSLSFFVISFPFPPTSLSEIDRTKIFFYFASVSRSFLFETIATLSKYTGAKQGCADKHSEDRQGIVSGRRLKTVHAKFTAR